MPIRFRCVYCEQLLGIARRKAGTVVKCPNCSGQLIVPPEHQGEASDRDAQTAAVTAKEASGSRKPAPAAAGTSTGAAEGGLLFERSDFDELLRPAVERHERAPEVPRPKPGVMDVEAPIDLADAEVHDVPATSLAPVEPIIAPKPAAPPRSGILLTPLRATFLCIVVVVGLALAFGGGILVGMLLRRPGP